MKKKFLLILFLVMSALLIFTCNNNGTGDDDDGIGDDDDDIVIPDDDDVNPDRPPIQSPTAVNRWTGSPTMITQSTSTSPYFGARIAVSRDGRTIVSGNFRDDRERNDDSDVFSYGAATILRYNGSTWSQYNVQPGDLGSLGLSDVDFGWSVAVSDNGDVVAIGAKRGGRVYPIPGGGTEYLNTGAVYIYRWSGSAYVESEKLTPPIADTEYPQHNMHFGNGVSLSGGGNIIAVGAPKYDLDDDYQSNNGISTGRVFVFRYDGTWDNGTPIDAINAPGRESLNFFGYSVAISQSGNRIVAGARKETVPGIGGNVNFVTNAGSAYIITWNGGNGSWNAEKIYAPDRMGDDYFGHSVAISGDGDTVVVGSYRSDPRGVDSGSAYGFTRSANVWTGVKLFSIYGRARDQAAYSVAVTNDGSVIASGNGLDGGTETYGRASLFSKDAGGAMNGDNPWTHENILWSSQRFIGDFFGRSIGMSQDAGVVAVGIPSLLSTEDRGRIAIFR